MLAGEEGDAGDALVGEEAREDAHSRTVRWCEVRQLIPRPARTAGELAADKSDLGFAADNRSQREVVGRVALGREQFLGGGEPAGRGQSSELRGHA